jgi:DNA polymerase-1
MFLLKAEPGSVLVHADFPATHLRIIACITQDPTLLTIFQEGENPHKVLAAKITGKAPDEISKDSAGYAVAKRIHYGFSYGMGLKRFQHCIRYGLKADLPEEKVRELYFSIYPGLRQYRDSLRREFYEGGPRPTSSLWGRRVLAQSGNLAWNYLIQSVEADLLKATTVALCRNFEQSGVAARIVLLLHDSIIVQTSEEDSEKVEKILTDVMGEIAQAMLGLPTPVEPEILR